MEQQGKFLISEVHHTRRHVYLQKGLREVIQYYTIQYNTIQRCTYKEQFMDSFPQTSRFVNAVESLWM